MNVGSEFWHRLLRQTQLAILIPIYKNSILVNVQSLISTMLLYILVFVFVFVSNSTKSLFTSNRNIQP